MGVGFCDWPPGSDITQVNNKQLTCHCCLFLTCRRQMCVSRFLRCVGVSLVPMAIICMVSNILLLLPELKPRFLLEGHVTREATWATGLWGSGLLVLLGARAFVQSSKTKGCWAFRSQMLCQALYSCVVLLAASGCSLVSATGLSQGPLCLYNSSSGLTWGVPLQPLPDRHSGYLYNQTLWSGVCMAPRSVVQWNVVLFSIMGITSALQAVLCGLNILNSLLGLILGQGFGRNRVAPVSV
ncbi:transmembrane 4 L6 family member 5 isoform 2-T2 [Fundulus diaphanus]